MFIIFLIEKTKQKKKQMNNYIRKTNKDKLNNNNEVLNSVSKNKTSTIIPLINPDSNNNQKIINSNNNNNKTNINNLINNIVNFNSTSPRPLTVKKMNNATFYFPINQVNNISTNDFNVILSSIPRDIIEKPQIANSVNKESEIKLQIINADINKKDAVTQTEEIFFRM
jgi:hypothetical protein